MTKNVQQEIKFKCLGIEILGNRNIEGEESSQATKATNTTAYSNNVSRIYKTAIRSLVTTENNPKTAKTRKIMETTGMRIFRKIAGKTLSNEKRSRDIRQIYSTENIIEWTLYRITE